MRKTRLGCTILEGHDIADLPLVSENAEILDNAIKDLEDEIGDLNADGITLPDGKTISEKFTEITKEIGNTEELDTETKLSLVAAINEINQALVAHKADYASQEIGKGADLIGLPDPNNLFTAANVGEGMQELFTNVSNGKSLVGTAITDVDNSLTVPTEPSFQDLADLIGKISTGKKWASGTALSSPTPSDFFYVDNRVLSTYMISVTGLLFKPSLIIAETAFMSSYEFRKYLNIIKMIIVQQRTTLKVMFLPQMLHQAVLYYQCLEMLNPIIG